MLARVGPSVFAVALGLVICGGVITAAGGDPALALAALFDGAFGSWDAASEVTVKTCPLLVTGLAVAVAFRASIWNIGAEGQLLIGAVIMAWLGTRSWPLPGWCTLPLALMAASAGGALWAGLAAMLKLRRRVSEVISTIMLNFIALALVSYLVHGPLMEAAGRYPQTDPVTLAMRLPRLVVSFRLHAGILVALAGAALVYVLLFRTVLGYQMRAVGWNPDAARLGGIRTDRCALLAFVLSGALAGLAGAIEISAVTHRLYERFSPGYGFTAIAVALLGGLHPLGVVGAAILFGALEAGSNSMERVAGVSSVLVSIIQATVILSLVAVEHRKRFRST